ncbi:Uncharacterised protein [Salmonella enterica subsp. enterica serovar Bovismorbificans]|uniref:Uncharacterized protein n=1 Tax=Salmonella enterica subsp. enterica serovar Bovismorbificans TaxID=58097 RepID=A0A655BUZ1_SALET|nr:Uncharacterised protein [Salmonella enterica subsp. enterica serovar Bovismorbificans]
MCCSSMYSVRSGNTSLIGTTPIVRIANDALIFIPPYYFVVIPGQIFTRSPRYLPYKSQKA